jgi:hypothetical protein
LNGLRTALLAGANGLVVASAPLAAVLDAKPGVRVLKSGAMQAADQT